MPVCRYINEYRTHVHRPLISFDIHLSSITRSRPRRVTYCCISTVGKFIWELYRNYQTADETIDVYNILLYTKDVRQTKQSNYMNFPPPPPTPSR